MGWDCENTRKCENNAKKDIAGRNIYIYKGTQKSQKPQKGLNI